MVVDSYDSISINNNDNNNIIKGQTSLCGKPEAEKIGIFCPRAILIHKEV